jgi:aspartate aminotransferase
METLSKKITAVSSSVTLEITALVKKFKKEGVAVVNLAAGEPDSDTFDYIKESAISAIKSGFTKYTPSSGTPDVKEAIVKKFKSDNGLDYTPENIVISCGAKHSIYNTLQVLCNEGDEVLIPSPYWVSYPEMVKLAGAVPRFIATSAKTGFTITPELLEKAITKKTKVLIINSPSNPTGAVYTKDQLRALVPILNAHPLYVISDEIYEELVYDANAHVSIASLDRAIFDKTVVVNGVSKSYAMTGWRIGYLAAAKVIAQAVTKLQDHSTSNPCSISQKATLAALTHDKNDVRRMKDEFQARRDLMVKSLGAIPQVRVFVPQGTFYCFVDIGALKVPAAEFAKRLLLEEKVAVVPGEAFGDARYIRLSFANTRQEITQGIEKMAHCIARHYTR